ncbi:MAG: DUF1080 domain-containing protein [Verrucomicrobia bacterium]|nr:DUF1080 domain-containing protein [Verrucomicrobiota bacterium]
MKSSIFHLLITVVLAMSLVSSVQAQSETELLTVLKNPDASRKQKQDACRELSRIATAGSVPVLAELLDDPKLSHMARYALEPIPDASVDAALREALGEVKGEQLAGVIGSLGVRRDERAVPALAQLLSHEKAVVSAAAARALGNIGNSKAAEALQSALVDSSSKQFKAVCEGLFRSAEQLEAEGGEEEALALYGRLCGFDKAPHQIRTASLRGAVLLRGEEGLPLLISALRAEDYRRFASAARISMELDGKEVTQALAEELEQLPKARQIVVLRVLGQRGDASCGDVLMKILHSRKPVVSAAAARALTRLAHAPAISKLAEIALDADGDLADVAKSCLAGFPVQAAKSAVMDMLSSEEAGSRLLGAELSASCMLDSAVPVLIDHVLDKEQSVALASLRALRELAGPDQLQAVVDLFGRIENDKVRREAENVAIRVGRKAMLTEAGKLPVDVDLRIDKAVYGDLPDGKTIDVTAKVQNMVEQGKFEIAANNGLFGDPTPGVEKKFSMNYTVNGVSVSRTVAEGETMQIRVPQSGTNPILDKLIDAMENATGPAKVSLLRVLAGIGGTQSLAEVRSKLDSNNTAMREAAMRALVAWQDDSAAPALLQVIRTADTQRRRALALRGLVRVVGLSKQPAPERVALLNKAREFTESSEDNLLLLSGYGNLSHPDALKAVVSMLDNKSVQTEAAHAAIRIAESIVKEHPDAVAGAMRRVIGTVSTQSIIDEADALLNQAEEIALKNIGYRRTGEWKALFNGKDLTGWTKTGNGEFFVEDGCLVGTQTDGRGGDLLTGGKFGEFELRVLYRVDWPANTGIWYRWGNGKGYQFDILKYENPVAFSGTLYCPGKMFLFRNTDASLEYRDGWNEARIRAAGPNLTQWINGVLIGSTSDNQLPSGKVGIQVHGGNQFKGMKVVIKRMEVRPLKTR